MSEDEAEYEVEYISRAQVVKSGKKAAWSFEVKWKNYGIDANTWEPISSFKGSEHFIDTFWEQTQEKRSWRNLKQFAVGDWVYRKGPPRGPKAKGKSKATSSAHSASNTSNRSKPEVEVIEDSEPEETTAKDLSESYPSTKKRRATAVEDVEEVPPSKRRRGRPTKSAHTEEDEPDSASRGPTLRKTQSISKLPRIPAVKSKSKSKPTESSSASLSTAAATQGTSRRNSKKSIVISKETSPDILLLDNPPIPDDTSSEADRRLVIESLDVNDTDVGDGDLFGDSNGDVEMQDGSEPAVQPEELSSGAPPPVPVAKLPAHRAKEANPRIKMMDDGFTSQSGLSVKAALAGASTRPQSLLSGRSRPNNSRAILGSTSLLTAGRNGGLISVRKHVQVRGVTPNNVRSSGSNGVEVVEVNGNARSPEPVADTTPVTGKEVLELAGLKAGDADATLPDFDDASDRDADGESDHDIAGHDDHVEHTEVPQGEPETAGAVNTDSVVEVREEQIVVIPKPMVNPPTALIGQSSSTNIISASSSAAWKQTTIFGPLGSRSVPSTPVEESATFQGSPESPSFFVVLGPAVDLPVVLKDVHPSKTPALRSLDTILNNAPGGVPGRFYKGENAAAIVNSFGLEGSSARIVLNCTATEVQKQNFERFRSLLKAGAIFVVMVGPHLLAFSSSENVELSSKLGMSPNLIGLGDNVLVTEVVIRDDLMYLDATMSDEDEKW